MKLTAGISACNWELQIVESKILLQKLSRGESELKKLSLQKTQLKQSIQILKDNEVPTICNTCLHFKTNNFDDYVDCCSAGKDLTLGEKGECGIDNI